ncbi:cytidylate kinase family protein [Chloroflexota bacterium]
MGANWEDMMAIITISRGTFSGGQSLAESVAERLGYRCLSVEELLTESANQFAVGADTLPAALDNRAWFLETVNLERLRYIAYVRATLLRAVRNDNLNLSWASRLSAARRPLPCPQVRVMLLTSRTSPKLLKRHYDTTNEELISIVFTLNTLVAAQ